MGNCNKKNKVGKDSASEIISRGSQLDMINALKDQGSYKVILLVIHVDTKLIIFMRGSRGGGGGRGSGPSLKTQKYRVI